ncbi:hypothetical protein HHL22_18670 [Hymenobacter sp. RP-2-7]|uniref:Uncharacterized protein n=1 Tax=Hymenobacter polaris TaxID=2682546 RepID=A0A7Y0AH28_9BACT|nr:hypothetical protein [Hymenobacter polaris]NML67233.1 hypothetical protein [Hymenobacter polaris]
MKLAIFRSLPLASQVRFVLALGTYLAHRLAEDREVHLYHLAGEGKGIFVELAYEEARDELVVLRSFASAVPLDAYMRYLCLPEW